MQKQGFENKVLTSYCISDAVSLQRYEQKWIK